MFETHHINIKAAERALSKLERVGDVEMPHQTFESYAEIREKGFKLFPSRTSRRASPARIAQMTGHCLVGVGLHLSLLTHSASSPLFVATCLASAIYNAILGGIGHNYVHTLKFPSLFLDWNGLSCYEWLHEHVHSHHSYTNTLNDHDAISMVPFLWWIPDPERRGRLGLPVVFRHAIFFISEIIVCIRGNVVHFMRWTPLFSTFRLKREVDTLTAPCPLWLQLGPILFLLRCASHIVCQGVAFGVCSLLFCMGVSGYYFSLLAHMNHANPHLSDDRPKVESHAEFVQCQLENTVDLKVPTVVTDLILSLNLQTVHHLFPTLDHSHLNSIAFLLPQRKSASISTLNTRVEQTLRHK